MAGAPGFTRTWAPGREEAWRSRAAVSAPPATDLWTATSPGPGRTKGSTEVHPGRRAACLSCSRDTTPSRRLLTNRGP